MRELHRILSAALREGSQLINVTEHIRKRHHRLDDLCVSAAVGALNLTATAVQIADNVAQIVLGRGDLNLHDRLEQLDAGLLGRLAHAAATGDLERQRRRIDVMIGAVIERRGEIDDREADQRSGLGDLANALLDRRNIFLRDVAALDFVLEDHALAAFARLDRELDPAELARAARLLLVGVVDVHLLRERLAIGDLRRADIGLDLEFALHAIDQDLEMELAHPLDDRLAALGIGRYPERRVLAGEAIERDAHLLLVGLRSEEHTSEL